MDTLLSVQVKDRGQAAYTPIPPGRQLVNKDEAHASHGHGRIGISYHFGDFRTKQQNSSIRASETYRPTWVSKVHLPLANKLLQKNHSNRCICPEHAREEVGMSWFGNKQKY
jgi:hypothetical protein